MKDENKKVPFAKTSEMICLRKPPAVKRMRWRERMSGNNSVYESSELILRMKSQLQQMNPAQVRIARYILDHTEELPGMPIGRLAKESGVSEATISRFVKFLGCTNYRAFQAEMVKSNVLRHERIRGYADVENMDDAYQVCRKIFDANMQCLEDTLAILDMEALDRAADLIVKSRKLCILAQGRSMVTATSIRLRLYRLGIACSSYCDPHEQAMAVSLLKEGDVVMGISTFGRSRSVLKNLRSAAARGAAVIGVSSYRGTPLEEVADMMLVTSSNEEASFGFEPSCSTVSQMVALDCLYILITNRMKEEAQECFRVTCEAIESERE